MTNKNLMIILVLVVIGLVFSVWLNSRKAEGPVSPVGTQSAPQGMTLTPGNSDTEIQADLDNANLQDGTQDFQMLEADIGKL